jgi:hypothetical protein
MRGRQTITPFLKLSANLYTPIRGNGDEARSRELPFIIHSLIPITGNTADVNPHIASSCTLIKGNLTPLKTVSVVGSPVTESHPSRLPVTVRDLVPAVDHLPTGEALELELALTAGIPLHNPLSGSSSYETLFASSGGSGVHS